MKRPHLDIFDSRRGSLFANAECRDCDYFLTSGCEAEQELIAYALRQVYEASPDTYIPGMRFRPSSDDAASRCPMLWPSFEYLEELKAQDRDALTTWREDMNRQLAVRMGEYA